MLELHSRIITFFAAIPSSDGGEFLYRHPETAALRLAKYYHISP